MANEVERAALSVVEQCFDLDPPARQDFLDRECTGSPELRARVERLLEMDQTGFRFLPTEPAYPQPSGMADTIPERIGAFRVVRLLGRGGMGTVVLAERDDGLYEQRVAIKLVRAGLLDARAEDRFVLERRILARLSHPGITRILDGGTLDGRPYLVMEYVEGEPVTDWLERTGADLRQTLTLFGAICAAMAHAHRSLVVHADIKPDNVLVSEDGTVKLVDFGVSRALTELEGGEVAGPAPLTRAYAAPERLAGEAATIAGDVYSLGALLHEMLTGARAEAGRPMSGIRRSRLAPAQLRGDLDAIVLKALAPVGERYGDVGELVADIERYRTHQPVRAQAPTLPYRLRKFVRRHWIGLAFVVLVAAAAAVSTVLYLDSRRQRAAAEARFEEVRRLAKFQLFGLYDRIAEVPGTTAARAAMAKEAQAYLDRLAAIPSAQPGVRLELAAGLDRLATVQGVPQSPNLGQTAAARSNLSRAAALLAALAAERPDDPGIAREIALNRILRARLAIWSDYRTKEAQTLLDEAERAVRRAEAGGLDLHDIDAARRSVLLMRLGWEENYPELARTADETLAWMGRWSQGERSPFYPLTLADALNARGDARFYLGDPHAALADYRRADAELAKAEARFPNNATVLARRMISGYNVATTLQSLGEKHKVVPMAFALLARGDRMLALEANDQALHRRQQINRELAAQVLAEEGRYAEAIAQQTRLVAQRSAAAAARPREAQPLRDLAFSQVVLGTLHWWASDRPNACALWQSAERRFIGLDRAGNLTPFDRGHSFAYTRHNLEICAGKLPVSAYRSPD